MNVTINMPESPVYHNQTGTIIDVYKGWIIVTFDLLPKYSFQPNNIETEGNIMTKVFIMSLVTQDVCRYNHPYDSETQQVMIFSKYPSVKEQMKVLKEGVLQDLSYDSILDLINKAGKPCRIDLTWCELHIKECDFINNL